MCGIVGYTGHRDAVAILLEGLYNLEYRGYDSAGLTVNINGEINTIKARGRVSELDRLCKEHKPMGSCGIAHTRWATHGEPSDLNSHPHYTENVSLIHNGIIENYLELKEKLLKVGYKFSTQTDTEIAAKLVDFYYEGNPLEAIRKALKEIDGSYAFAILFKDVKDKVYIARKGSPLIVAFGEGENFVASDISAVLRHTNKYISLEDGEMGVVTPQEVCIFDENADKVDKDIQTAHWTIEEAKKDGFDHFMLKEIYEQPKAITATINPRIKDGIPNFDFDNISKDIFKNTRKINIVACGTAMYAGMVGKHLIESIARIPCEIEIASEFRYKNPILSKEDLVIIISQSGETADSLAALRLAKQVGAIVVAVVNVVGSTIAREADYVIQTLAGPEIAVASTKAYSVQVAIMYLFAFKFAYETGKISNDEQKDLVAKLFNTIKLVEETLKQAENVKKVALGLKDVSNMFFIGRGIDYALSCEGSLKLKEISYIHCEAYAAGELKHGPISLIEKNIPVVALLCQEALAAKTMSNIKEVKARGATVIAICKQGQNLDEDGWDSMIVIPQCEDIFSPLPTAVILQLLAYYTSVIRECDVDRPRNLAKSVTVE